MPDGYGGRANNRRRQGPRGASLMARRAKKSVQSRRAGKTGNKGPAKAKATPLAAPWIAHYPPGVSWDAPLKPMSLPDMFDAAAKEFSGLIATDFLGARLTYGELAAITERV